jgi:hypothetical protein
MSIIASSSPPPRLTPQSSQFVGMLRGTREGDGDGVDVEAIESGEEANELVEVDGPGRFQKLCNDRWRPP